MAFGTSGHRGSSFRSSFNEAHILAISQAICAYRLEKRISGPLYLGKDTHALSEPAAVTALEVFAANGVEVMVDEDDGYTPTPVISHAILTHNKGRTSGLADGIVISPSHNPPDEGGFKYNPPNGGPADVDVTGWIERHANGLLKDDLRGVRRIPYERARNAPSVHRHDYVGSYVGDLGNVVNMEAIAASGVKIGIDPLGGASVDYWQPVIDRYGIDATIVNKAVDPHLPLHDARLGRQDPDGLLVALRHGEPDRHPRQVRHRLRQRHRRRPPRHRQPLGRADEPQSLPDRGNRLSLPQPARVGCGSGRRQDNRQQQHHRPHRCETRSQAL